MTNAKGYDVIATPRSEGLRMPAEFDEHECTVIVWPARESLWGHHLDEAKSDYAAVVRAVAAFEEVVVVANPGAAAEVLNYCGIGVTVTEIPVDDSWVRDSGPIVVSDGAGRRAVVQLGFDGWGRKYVPFDKDARLATALADVFGLPVFRAPIVSEGGAFLTDGEGTLFTTEGSVIHEVRNPGLTREGAEAVFRDYLGVDTVMWLEAFPDRDTDGHVDGIANVVAPGVLALYIGEDSDGTIDLYSQRNLDLLASVQDAAGRHVRVEAVSPQGYATIDGEEYDIPYLNHYLPAGGVVVPVGDTRTDEAALARLAEIYPDREIVGVPGGLLSYGGGGPHCITQQIPRR
jgi:agmatine deiminase